MAGSDGTAELEVNEVPDLSLEGAAAAAPKCQVEETCTLATETSCKYEMDPTASAAGDYREGEMLVVLSNHDKELYIANGNQIEEMPIVSEQIGIDLCHNQHEQDFVAVGNKDGSIVHSDELPTVAIGSKDDEGHSLVYSDELPTVAVEQKDDGDHSLIYSDELPAVAIRNKEDEDGSIAYSDELPTIAVGNKEDEDRSIAYSDELPTVAVGNKEDGDRSLFYSELPTVVIENKDTLDELQTIDVSVLTADSSPATRENKDEQLTDVTDSNQRQSPSTESSEEQTFVTSHIEEKYVVVSNQDEQGPAFTDHQDELYSVAIGNKDINLFSGDGEHFRDQQTIEDSGQMLTNSAVLEASFSSHDDCADIGDVNIAVDMFLLVDDTKPDVDPINLLNHSSNYHTPKTVDQPQCLSDVQFSLSETVTVSHSPLGGGTNYVIDVGDKPSEESSRPLTGTGDVIVDSQPATGDDSDAVVVDPMVDMDAECENIVIMSISDTKHDSEDEEFDFEIAQDKDDGLPHSGSGEHVSRPKVVDLEKPKKDEDVFVPVTGDLAPRSSTSLTEQDEPTKSKALKEAEEAWATVDDMTAGFGAGGDFAVAKRPVTVLVSYDDAIKTLCQSDIIKYKPHIRTSVTRRGFQALKYIFCGPPRLHEDLVPNRDLAFCMAACPFWNDNVLHLQVLQTIYKKLTGSRFDCPRYGTHWEQIGFQGTDPATDLRGVGFLALLHLLYALTTPKVTHIIRDIYKLSQNEVQNFPLCIMSINMTRIAVEALREDCLNKWCNHTNQVIPVLNEFYLGTFLRMYHIWKHEGKTIKDSGFVLQDVEKFVKKHPAMVLRNLEVYAQTHAQSPPSPQQSPPSPPNVTVSPLSPDELDEYINEPYPSPSELDVMKTDEDVSNKNFFAVCKNKNNDTENLGNLI